MGTHRQVYRVKRASGVEIAVPCTQVAYAKTPYNDIRIVDTDAWGRCLLLDGVVNTSSRYNDVIHESLYLPPLLAHPATRDRSGGRVLILGGGDMFGANLCLEWGVDKVVQVEIDEQVLKLSSLLQPASNSARMYHARAHGRLEVIVGDALEYVGDGSVLKDFDVVVFDMTDPAGPATGVYAEDFLANFRAWVHNGGAYSTQCDSPDTIGDDYYDIVLRHIRCFGRDKVHPYRVWVPCYLEHFGRIMGGPKWWAAPEPAPAGDDLLLGCTWATPSLMASLEHSAYDRVTRDLVGSSTLRAPLRETPSVAEWSIQ